MKNYTTPRTLSEAQFSVGYQTVYPTRRKSFLARVWLAVWRWL